MSINVGKLNPGIEYQFEIIAYTAAYLSQNLSACDEVDDFEIYTNQDVPLFDDIIIKITYKFERPPFVYMGQIRYYANRKINFNMGGKDALDKYFKKIVEIQNKDNRKPFLKSLLQNVPDENIKFFYFSNSFLSPTWNRSKNTLENVIKLDDKTHCYLECDTSYKSIFSFRNSSTCYKLTTESNHEYKKNFDKLHFFLNQPAHEEIASRIVKFNPNIICISAANDIINYVDAYLKKSEKAKLTQHLFETHLLRLCLSPFLVLPTKAFKINPEPAHTWNQLVMKFDITIISTEMKSYIFGCLWQEIIKLYESEFNWNECITDFKNINKEVDISYNFHRLSGDKRISHWLYIPDTINELLIEMWKSDYLPLVLSPDTNVSILNQFKHLKKRFVILDIKDKIYKKISTLNLEVFANAENICNIDVGKEFLKNVFISLQGREPVDVYSIVKEDTDVMNEMKCDHLLYFIREWKGYVKPQLYSDLHITKRVDNDDNEDNAVRSVQVTQNEKLEFTEGEKQFGLDADENNFYLDNYRAVPILGRCIKTEERYIKRFLRKATLEATIFNSSMKVICFVTGDLNGVDWMARNQIIQGSVDYVTYKTETELEQGRNAIAAIREDDIKKLWPKFSAKEYPLIYVKVENNLLSILKYQNCDSLISYSIFNEESFFKETSTGITLITGEPGSGKSSLLRYLFNICGKENYVLFCDLNDYRQSLLERKTNSFKNTISFILGKEAKQSTNANRHSMCPSYLDFLQKFLVRSRELILFLDSFDEVLPVCQEPVLDFIRVLKKQNVRLIIACRSVMADVLINAYAFEVAATKIETLNTKDIKEYIVSQKLSDDEFQKYPREFQENPMYLNFLVELRSLSPDTITRCTLYNEIIKKHIERFYNKKGEAYNSTQYESLREDILDVHKSLALFEVFGNAVCKVTGLVYKDLKKKCIATGKAKLGLIIRFNDDGPVFLHRTFAEYLIAEWVTENIDQKYVNDIYEQLLDKNMIHARQFLDDILCENLRLHKAVLAGDLPLVEKLCSEDDNHLKEVDQLNRNALHLAAIYFFDYYCRRIYKVVQRQSGFRILETIVRHMKINGLDFSNNYDSIMKLNWLQYLKPAFENPLRSINIVCEMPVTSEIYFVCTERIEEGIVWSMDHLMLNTAIELLKRKECLLSKYYDKIRLAAITTAQFKELLQLVELQNNKNIKFEILRKACKDLSAASTVSKCTDLRLRGGFTALHVACIYGSTDVVKELLKLGAEVDAIDDFKYEPLSYSVIQGSVEIVTCLVEHISSVNQLNRNRGVSMAWGCEPYLHFSLQKNYIEIAKVLLEHGFDINERNCDGETALHVAVNAYKDTDNIINEIATKIKLLLNYGPNCNIQDGVGNTPLHRIIGKVVWSMTSIANSEKDITLKNGLEVVDCLLKSGADINMENKWGHTPLQQGLKIIERQLEWLPSELYNISHLNDVLEILLKAGADVNHKAKCGSTALHIAAKIFNANFVQILLDSGGDVDLEDENGDTALTISANFSELHTRILLNAGADVNHRNKIGDTALHVAAKCDQLDIAKILLKNGADVEIENEDGNTALLTATIHTTSFRRNYRGFTDDRLLKTGPNIITPIERKYFDECVARIPPPLDSDKNKFSVGILLLKAGAKPNHQNRIGETALHLAARDERINAVKILLHNNADKNVVNKEGYTPISIAKQYKNKAAVDILSK